MSCCGKRRQAISAGAQGVQAVATREPGGGVPHGPSLPGPTVAYFEYTGATGLTVLGPVTGRRYRFDGRGVRVAVDLRDRRSVAAVPGLRSVRGPA